MDQWERREMQGWQGAIATKVHTSTNILNNLKIDSICHSWALLKSSRDYLSHGQFAHFWEQTLLFGAQLSSHGILSGSGQKFGV